MRFVSACIASLFVAMSAAAATSLDVVIPANSTTGVQFTFTVTAKNGAAIDTAYTGTVHFTSSDTTATLPADYTFTPADNGTRQFNATMGSAGQGANTATRSITATDTVTASITGSDNTQVRWNEALARKFRIIAPATVNREEPFSIQVDALNVNGWIVPDYTGTVHFIASRNEVLPADYTFVPGDNGSHEFMVTATKGDYSLFSVKQADDGFINGSSGEIRVICPELIVTATNSGPACAGEPVTLYGNANLPVISWMWVSTVGHPPVFQSNQQNPIAYGRYTYILNVHQANECIGAAQTTVVTHQPQVPQGTVSSTGFCGAGNITVSLTNAELYSGLQWQVYDGTIVNGQGTPSVEVAPNSGATSVRIDIAAVELSSGCDASYAWTVPAGSVGNGPTAHVDADLTLCDESTAQIPVTLAGTAPFRIVWSDGVVQDNIATSSTTRVVSETGAYSITSISDANCAGTATGAAHVSLGESPEVVSDPSNAHIKSGETATLTVLATGTSVHYVWYEGQTGDRSKRVALLTTPSFTTPQLNATTKYWVEVENSCGADQSQAAVVSVGSSKQRAARH